MLKNEEDREEQMQFYMIINSYLGYKTASIKLLKQRISRFNSIPKEHQSKLPAMLAVFREIESAIEENQVFCNDIVKPNLVVDGGSPGSDVYLCGSPLDRELLMDSKCHPQAGEEEKVRATLRLFVRHWSEEGKEEREASFTPILEALDREYASLAPAARRKVAVLCPGCGLGRLPFEIAARGYTCQGNEYSIFMLLAANFALNNFSGQNCYSIRPYIHNTSNIAKRENALRKIPIPDVVPDFGHLDVKPDFSMCGGEFVEVYGRQEASRECVVTCFFLDTAHNVVEYIETISRVIKDGGLWINLGPLLFHWTEYASEVSIEVSWDELAHVIRQSGFEIEREEFRQVVYASDSKAMLKHVYNCVFFSARRVKRASDKKD